MIDGVARNNIKNSIFLFVFCMLVFIPTISKGGNTIETDHLIVSDPKEQLSGERLKQFAEAAEANFKKIIGFWAIPEKVFEEGKIHLELDMEWNNNSFSVYQMEMRNKERTRVVRVYGIDTPMEMLHKLTHALFQTNDKMVRNMIGIPTEYFYGNKLSFPLCGYSADSWVSVFVRTGSYVPLKELGQRHEDWGMTFRNNMPQVYDRRLQHTSYAEAGSFGAFLIKRFGINKIKSFYHESRHGDRHWQTAFGLDLPALENEWLASLKDHENTSMEEIDILMNIWQNNPKAACRIAQRKASKK